jgi:hypothetical protein
MTTVEPTPATDTSWTKEELLDAASQFREQAASLFLQDGEHRPMSFLFCTKHPDTGEAMKMTMMIPVVGDFGEDTKDAYSSVLRALAHKTRAVGVIFISEIWMVVTDTENEEEAVRKYAGSLASHPQRQEHLMLTCEHSRFGCRMWVAKIVREGGKPDGKPTLEAWRGDEGFTNRGGRFVHLLPSVD